MNFSTKPAACGETAPQKREQLQEKTVKLTFLGHACFLVQAGAHTLILDPFLTNSRTAAMRAADVEATHMLISHAHGDHIGDAAPIAERCGCTVFCTPETGAMLHAPHARQENGQPRRAHSDGVRLGQVPPRRARQRRAGGRGPAAFSSRSAASASTSPGTPA